MRMQAPEGMGGLSIEGRAVQINEEGVVNADPRDVAALREHGFVEIGEVAKIEDVPDVDTMDKGQLVELAVSFTRSMLNAMNVEELRSQVKQAQDRARKEIEDDAAEQAAEEARQRGAAEKAAGGGQGGSSGIVAGDASKAAGEAGKGPAADAGNGQPREPLLSEEHIADMTKTEMQDFLKSQKASLPANASQDALRAKVTEVANRA